VVVVLVLLVAVVVLVVVVVLHAWLQWLYWLQLPMTYVTAWLLIVKKVVHCLQLPPHLYIVPFIYCRALSELFTDNIGEL